MKNLYLIVGASGTGKSTLADILAERLDARTVRSYTTRLPRYSKEDGHVFVTHNEFDKLRNELCAYTEYNGYEYGVTASQLDEADIYVIDPAGVTYLKEHYHGKPLHYIWLTASASTRIRRMTSRGDKYSAIWERLQNDTKDFSYATCYTALTGLSGIEINTDGKYEEDVFGEAYDYIYGEERRA